jgi:hypothetical protein
MILFLLFSVEYKSTSMVYRKVDGFSGNLCCFPIFVHILSGDFPHVCERTRVMLANIQSRTFCLLVCCPET